MPEIALESPAVAGRLCASPLAYDLEPKCIPRLFRGLQPIRCCAWRCEVAINDDLLRRAPSFVLRCAADLAYTWLYGPGPCLQSVTGGSGGRHPGKPAYGPGRHHLHTAAPSSSVRFRSLERTPALALNPCPAAHACMPPSHPLLCVVLHASPTLAALLRELTGCSLIHCRRLRHSSRARVDGARRVERSTSTARTHAGLHALACRSGCARRQRPIHGATGLSVSARVRCGHQRWLAARPA